MNFEYVRDYYNVPACHGRRVVVGERPGIIAEDRGHYIGVNFDDSKPGFICNAHPTSEVKYGEIGAIRKPTRSQKRYQDFLRYGDAYDSFAEFLGIVK